MEKRKNNILLYISIILFTLFIVWTVLVKFVNTSAIGPEGSVVGMASLNGYFHDLIGFNNTFYKLTDYLEVIHILIVLGFAVLGIVQLIKRKSIKKVDLDIIALGVFYIAMFAFYLIFEVAKINYRPVIVEGKLEASYPSSTTLLTLCVLPTALIQFKDRIKNKNLSLIVFILILIFTLFMFVGRIISGVHWISDIIGGVILSASLVTAYCYFYYNNINKKEDIENENNE